MPLPPDVARLATSFVLASFGLCGLDLVPHVTIESASAEGYQLWVWITDHLRQRVWVSVNGRSVALSLDEAGMWQALEHAA